MKIKKIISAAAAAFLIAAAAPVPQKAMAEDISYILIEADTGTVLEEKNADVRRSCGYMTKLMSLLLIAEDMETGKFSADDMLTASQSVAGTKGSVIWLEPGDSLSADELLRGAIIGNANDAVTVLAEKSEGKVDDFVKRMNGEAFNLGLRETVFRSPNGCTDEEEYTTVREFAVICSELVKYDFMLPYFSTWRDFIKNESVELVNENTLSRTYDRHIGLKAAHSEKSGYCIAEAARDENGITYIAVVFGAPDEEASFAEAKRLVKKGFSDYKVTVPGFLDELLMPMKVTNGVDSAVEIKLKTQSTVVIPKGVSELHNEIILPEYIDAPVKKDQNIGTAGFYNGDTLVFETDIVTKNNVERLSYGYILKKILLNLIGNH